MDGDRSAGENPAHRGRDVRSAAAVRRRPAPQVWSVLEYGGHVRDVCRVFDERVEQMTARDSPVFPNWDQAAALAGRFDRVRASDWTRTGLRSDGSQFTVDSLARYFRHDLVHHRHDISLG